jgi:exopolysaccharide biosynthesis polyprenyl glycosylphosphotransferase
MSTAVPGTTVETTALDAPAELELAGAASRRAAELERRLVAHPWALPAIDLLALVGAFALAVAWTPGARGLSPLAIFPVLAVLSLSVRGAYAPRLRLIVLDSFGLAAGSVSVAAMCTLALGLFVSSGDPGSGLLFRAWLLGVVCVGLARVVFTLETQRLRASGANARRTVIVGAGEVGARLARRLEQSPEYGLLPIGFLDADPPAPEVVGGRGAPVLGPPDDLASLIALERVDHVILAFSGVRDRALLPLVRCCSAQGVGVSIVPRFFDSINNRLAYEPIGGLPIGTLRSTDPMGPTFALKHAIDRAVAAVLLVILAPLLAVIAVLVKRSSPGPVLFRQRRVGRDGQDFDMLKFRTMAPSDTAQAFVPPGGLAPGGVEGVDRRTRVGRVLRRTSLDELPQLLNVVRGEMSLVGPRPERPEYVEGFAADLARYGERHRVRSGMTGLSQVHGLRGQSPIADRVELDNYYIENWSLGLDLKILLMTILAITRPVQ